jgi:hypothetical protein
MRLDQDTIHFNNHKKKEMNHFHIARWKKRWNEYAFFVHASISTHIDLIDKKRFKLHDQLKRSKAL